MCLDVMRPDVIACCRSAMVISWSSKGGADDAGVVDAEGVEDVELPEPPQAMADAVKRKRRERRASLMMVNPISQTKACNVRSRIRHGFIPRIHARTGDSRRSQAVRLSACAPGACAR